VQQVGEQGAKRTGALGKARAARGRVDNFTRTQLWVNGMSMGMTPEDAARMVQEFHFNYSELSDFDREVMRRIVPFWVFPRKVVENQARTLARTPGRLVNVAKPFMGRDDENDMMTKWEGEGFKLRLDRDGKTLTVLNGIDLPVRSLDMLWRGDRRKTLEGFLGSTAPAIKVAYMAASGREPFRGKPFDRIPAPTLGRIVENWPKPLRDSVGWKLERDSAGRPKYTVNEERVRILMEASTLSRIFTTGDRYFRDSMNEPGAPNFWLQFFTGLQLKKLNLDDEQKRQLESKRRIAEQEAVKQGLLREHRSVYKP
jgi:hypothetical protein